MKAILQQFLLLLLPLVYFFCMQLATSSHPHLVPSDPTELASWVAHHNMMIRAQGSHDQRLSAAENGEPRVIKVANRPEAAQEADFRTVTEAINSIPDGNVRRTVVWIGGGYYWEKITISVTKPFVTLYGDPNDMPTIIFNGTALQYGTVYSATMAVESDYFMAVNVIFQNAAPMPTIESIGSQAVAMRISGDKAAFYNCHFLGFQDTLCDDRGRHLFMDCYVRGTVDFIFGNGQSLYLNVTIESVAEQTGVITAQAREKANEGSGFCFIHCSIRGTHKDYTTYLGRAWKESPRVVFAYTFMPTLINPAGWYSGHDPNPRIQGVYYGEYKCKGPGALATGRVRYAKFLNDEEASPFLSMTFINAHKWLLPPPLLTT
ncbi:Putative pectinesterase 63 [Linum grandiflorum]